MTIFHRHPAIPSRRNTPKFTSFKPLTNDDVKREIMGMKNKSCELDQISISTLKGLSPPVY